MLRELRSVLAFGALAVLCQGCAGPPLQRSARALERGEVYGEFALRGVRQQVSGSFFNLSTTSEPTGTVELHWPAVHVGHVVGLGRGFEMGGALQNFGSLQAHLKQQVFGSRSGTALAWLALGSVDASEGWSAALGAVLTRDGFGGDWSAGVSGGYGRHVSPLGPKSGYQSPSQSGWGPDPDGFAKVMAPFVDFGVLFEPGVQGARKNFDVQLVWRQLFDARSQDTYFHRSVSLDQYLVLTMGYRVHREKVALSKTKAVGYWFGQPVSAPVRPNPSGLIGAYQQSEADRALAARDACAKAFEMGDYLSARARCQEAAGLLPLNSRDQRLCSERAALAEMKVQEGSP